MELLSDVQQLKTGIIRTILMRRVTLAVFTLVAFPMAVFLQISLLDPLLYTPLMWLIITFPFRRMIDRQRTLHAVHGVHAAYFVAEILLITLLVHRLGGIAWIGGMFYVFTVIYANFFLPRLHGAVITGLVAFAYTGIALAEYLGVLPHRPLFASAEPAHQNLLFILTTLLAGPVAVYAILALTVRTFAGIYARKNRLLAVRERALEKMSQELLRAHDEERRRIARSLHDELIQCLAAVKLYLAPVRDALDEDRFEQLGTILDRAIAQTRTLAYSVRPPLLDDLGLLPSVQRLADGLSQETGLEILVTSSTEARLDTAIESLLFHVASECMQNAARHAVATTMRVHLQLEAGRARLSIQDDGQGFPDEKHLGLGLRGVQERVHMCGGKLDIQSAPGSGSCVTVEVPSYDHPCPPGG
jgi:signal transduction histidine kinase